MSQPAPFTIVRNPGEPAVATNGAIALMCPDEGGVVKLRRGIRGAFGAPMGERLLPHLNALAGEIVQNPAMPAEEIAKRLHVLRLACEPEPPQHIEWAYAELGDVRVYTDGNVVVLTRNDLRV